MENKIRNQIDGLIVIDKEKGYTSNDCLSIIKKILHPIKLGHTGTLDINATGVLVCLLGCGTKSQDYLMSTGKKIYEAELILGFSTDSEDITGKDEYMFQIDENTIDMSDDVNKVKVDGKIIDKEKIIYICNSFIGEYKQIPPMYSSKKVAGKKLLYLAKKGIEVERKPCNVKIYNIEVEKMKKFSCIAINYETNEKKKYDLVSIDLKVECSKGTYIRTLCKDIGERLKIKACMGNLKRLRTSNFSINESYKISEIEKKVKNNDFSFIKMCLYQSDDAVVTFGKFETLHLGHQMIINKVVTIAREKKLKSTVLSIGKTSDSKILSVEQKISKLKYLGVDNVINFPFNEWTKRMSPEDFVDDILIKQLRAKIIVVGSDCSFGDKGSGDKELLKKICKKNNIEVLVIDKLKVKNIDENENMHSDEDISSTLLNIEYEKENINFVNKLLGK